MKENNARKKGKKILCSLLMAGMTVCNLTGCSDISAKGLDEGLVVLGNQEEDINDVLAIKQIIEIQDFLGYHWLDDNHILGVFMNEGIRNIAIYNVQDKTVDNITDNKDSNKFFTYRKTNGGRQYEPPKNYIIFEESIKGIDYCGLLVYDIKKGKMIRIDENIDGNKIIDNKQIYYSKGFKLYRYNIPSNEKTEIELPEELIKKLKVYWDNFDEYLDNVSHVGDDLSGDLLKAVKKSFEEDKKNNCIASINVDGDEIQLASHLYKYYLFNMETNTFKEGRIEYDNQQQDDTTIGKVAKVLENKVPRELWKTDTEGNLIKIIDKSRDFVRNMVLSPDESKLVYEGAEYAFSGYEERKKYIYDFESEKKITLFGSYEGVFWNKESNKLLCNNTVGRAKKLSSKIVIFND